MQDSSEVLSLRRQAAEIIEAVVPGGLKPKAYDFGLSADYREVSEIYEQLTEARYKEPERWKQAVASNAAEKVSAAVWELKRLLMLRDVEQRGKALESQASH